MSSHGAPHVTLRQSYGSALCINCPWKFSGEDEDATAGVSRRDPTAIERAAEEHACASAHEVSLVITAHTTFDYRPRWTIAPGGGGVTQQ